MKVAIYQGKGKSTNVDENLSLIRSAAFFSAEQGARLIIFPARAYENQLFVVYVNRCGAEADLIYCGLSCVVGPDGEDLVRAGRTEGLFFADTSFTQPIKTL